MAGKMHERMATTRSSYDRVAARYLERFARELDEKPFDRDFLDDIAAASRQHGWVIDLGCGPGQIGAYLAAKGLRVLSVDLSLEMLCVASTLRAGATRLQADMRGLPFADNSIAGAVAFYSLIHIPPTELAATLAELQRVLITGGLLAATVHVTPPNDRARPGAATDDAALHIDEMLTERVDLNFYFYGTERIATALEEAGFGDVQATERTPYGPDVEAQTRRAYIVAQKRR
jgi:SAM-dependent methyltransferase